MSNQTKYNNTETSEAPAPKTRRRSWPGWVIAGLVIIVAVVAAVNFIGTNGSAAETAAPGKLNFAEVVVTDLVQEETYNGTLGTISSQPVKSQLSGTITEIPVPGDTISQGEALFAINNQPVILLYGELPAFRDITIGEEIMTVPSYQSGTVTWVPEPGTVIQQGDVFYMINNQPVFALYGDQPAYRHLSGGYYQEENDGTFEFNAITQLGYDVLQLEEALIALGYDPNGKVVVDGQFTFETTQMVRNWQRNAGAVDDGIVHFGEIVFIPGLTQVLDILTSPGEQVGGGMMTVSTGEPASGTDVEQLEGALAALGYDADGLMVADGIYSIETYQAVMDFQAAAGLEQDGIIHVGEVAFLPGSLQVKNQMETGGSFVGLGSSILEVSLSEKMVNIALPAKDQGILVVGDAVTIEMPDNSKVPGTVVYVSQTALAGQNTWDPKTFEVRIEFDDPAVAEGLDEAPVDVIVISGTVQDVKAIPVSALLALLEGGYAVELDAGDGKLDLIGVEVGFFGSNSMIEIISESLQPGDRVVVP